MAANSVKVHTNLLNTLSVGLITGATSPVTGSQSLLLGDELDALGDGDVTGLVMLVLRQSYLNSVEDLKDYANKVKFYNQLKLKFKSGVLIDAKKEVFPPPCDCPPCPNDGSD